MCFTLPVHSIDHEEGECSPVCHNKIGIFFIKYKKANFKKTMCGVGEGGAVLTSSLQQEATGAMRNMVFIFRTTSTNSLS